MGAASGHVYREGLTVVPQLSLAGRMMTSYRFLALLLKVPDALLSSVLDGIPLHAVGLLYLFMQSIIDLGRNPDPSVRDELPAPEPFNTLIRAFSPYEHIDRETYAPLIPYLQRMSVSEGTVLWTQDQAPDGLYIVESGILRATYYFADPTPPMVETMVPGTIAGELSMLSGLERNATCVVERAAVLWKLSTESLARLQQQKPELAGAFTKLILKGE